MHTVTGEIYNFKDSVEEKKFIEELPVEDRKFIKPMKLKPTNRQMKRNPPKIGRNEVCPCGSGKKFKKCCLVRNAGI